jgi:hypothetical protein
LKIFLLRESDFEDLISYLNSYSIYDCDINTTDPRFLYDDIHRNFNYKVRTWIDKVKSEESNF